MQKKPVEQNAESSQPTDIWILIYQHLILKDPLGAYYLVSRQFAQYFEAASKHLFFQHFSGSAPSSSEECNYPYSKLFRHHWAIYSSLPTVAEQFFYAATQGHERMLATLVQHHSIDINMVFGEAFVLSAEPPMSVANPPRHRAISQLIARVTALEIPSEPIANFPITYRHYLESNVPISPSNNGLTALQAATLCRQPTTQQFLLAQKNIIVGSINEQLGSALDIALTTKQFDLALQLAQHPSADRKQLTARRTTNCYTTYHLAFTMPLPIKLLATLIQQTEKHDRRVHEIALFIAVRYENLVGAQAISQRIPLNVGQLLSHITPHPLLTAINHHDVASTQWYLTQNFNYQDFRMGARQKCLLTYALEQLFNGFWANKTINVHDSKIVQALLQHTTDLQENNNHLILLLSRLFDLHYFLILAVNCCRDPAQKPMFTAYLTIIETIFANANLCAAIDKHRCSLGLQPEHLSISDKALTSYLAQMDSTTLDLILKFFVFGLAPIELTRTVLCPTMECRIQRLSTTTKRSEWDAVEQNMKLIEQKYELKSTFSSCACPPWQWLSDCAATLFHQANSPTQKWLQVTAHFNERKRTLPAEVQILTGPQNIVASM